MVIVIITEIFRVAKAATPPRGPYRISIDFYHNSHRRKNPQKENRVRWGVNIATPLSLFPPKKTILNQEVLKTHANIK